VAGLVIHTTSDSQTRAIGECLGPELAPGDVVLLSGDLGAGKTQLTKGIACGLGVMEPVTSPTFNILLVHEGRIPLYHFDLYRLDDAAQLEDLDYFGTLEADGVSVVEWGDRFSEAAPLDGLSVVLRIEGDTGRRLEVRALGTRGQALAGRWAAAVPSVPGVRVSGGERS
jgi:tRNA threonylcarbamoyladenosine biosynthesis protein TsaE